MARGRMLNTTVANDLRLNELSLAAHCAYMMAIPHLDRDGIMPGHPKIVAGKVCPLRPELGAQMESIIAEWADAGLVIVYKTSNGPALYFAGFQKNQGLGATYMREGKSIFPPPPGYSRTERGLVQTTHDQLMTNSRNGQAEDHHQDQVKDQDQSSSSPTPSSLPDAQTDDDDLEGVLNCWAENMPGKVTPILKRDLAKLVKECTARNVIHGITVAIEHDKRIYAYVATVARNHSSGFEPPGRGLTGTDRSALLTRANLARGKIRTAEQLGGTIDPQWQKDIEAAKGLT